MGDRGSLALAMGLVVCLMAGCDDGSDPRPARERAVVAESVNGFIGGATDANTGGRFSEPSDVAVSTGAFDDPSDDKIFVVEADKDRNERVQRLDRHGNFELAWGANVVRAGEPGDKGTGPEICRRAASCSAAPPGSAEGAFRMPTAVAVNDTTGDVYVMDSGNRRVQQFSAGGRFVRAWGWGVASGAARFEICAADCRAGRHGRAEGDANPGQLADLSRGGVAVRPGRGDVFVTDGGNNRVMRFGAGGRFLNAYRWDDDRWAGRGWPRHVAVDREGVVYVSDSEARSQIVRFDSEAAADEPGDADALLAPIGSGDPDDDESSTGLEIDSAGNLVAMWDINGPPIVVVIPDPGADGDEAPKPRSTMHLVGYVSSTNGLGVGAASGVVFLAKSRNLNNEDPSTIFNSCPLAEGGTRDCQGLLVVTVAGPPTARLGRLKRIGARAAALTGSVTARGAISYRFQTSRDGHRWSDVHPARRVTASRAERVRAVARGLEPGAGYKVRLALTRIEPFESRQFTSTVGNVAAKP